MALTKAGIKFTDQHLPMAGENAGAERARMKEELGFPNDGFPMLKLADGTVMVQSAAIYKFVGKYTGFYPNGSDLAAAKESAEIDTVMECVKDMQVDLRPSMGLDCPFFEGDEGKGDMKNEIKMSMRGAYGSGTWQKRKTAALDFLSTDPNGLYFACGKMTFADFCMYGIVHWLSAGVLDGIDKKLCPGEELIAWKEKFTVEAMDGWKPTKPA